MFPPLLIYILLLHKSILRYSILSSYHPPPHGYRLMPSPSPSYPFVPTLGLPSQGRRSIRPSSSPLASQLMDINLLKYIQLPFHRMDHSHLAYIDLDHNHFHLPLHLHIVHLLVFQDSAFEIVDLRVQISHLHMLLMHTLSLIQRRCSMINIIGS